MTFNVIFPIGSKFPINQLIAPKLLWKLKYYALENNKPLRWYLVCLHLKNCFPVLFHIICASSAENSATAIISLLDDTLFQYKTTK